MNILDGIQNFLTFINDNWTSIVVILALIASISKKVKVYLSKSDEEKIAIVKRQICESILKMVSDAEEYYYDWSKAGSIKRSQVIEEIFIKYPVLSKVVNQTELIEWIDNEIDNALETLRKVIEENKETKNN